jgi:hypothetical protein
MDGRPSSILTQAIMSICTFAISQIKNITRSHSRPYLEADLEGMTALALFDSGADISCVSEEAFRKIPVWRRPKQLEKPKTICRSASGNQLQIKGVYELSVKVLGKRVTHPFRVIKQLQEPVIIGADFMNKHLLAYNPQQKRVFWQNETDWTDGVATLQHAIILPPFASRLVTANVRTDHFQEPQNGQTLMVNVLTEEPFSARPTCFVKI